MKVLVIGSGGREHALVWKIAQSPKVTKVYCAPGNAGIAELAECVSIPAEQVQALAKFAAREQIGLTVVGPEAPLVAGIVERFEAHHLPIFGPSQRAAELEGSKVFAKQVMHRHNIPTAGYTVVEALGDAEECIRKRGLPFVVKLAGSVRRQERTECHTLGQLPAAVRRLLTKAGRKGAAVLVDTPDGQSRECDSPEAAAAIARDAGFPVVVKADGLAAGKGVFVCHSRPEALDAIAKALRERVFGDAGNRLVIEECLVGEEVSILALTDGETILPLPTSQDHKRIYDHDEGPNTGGMGAYSPAPVVTDELSARIEQRILIPIVHAMNREDRPYKGVVYAGLMLTDDGPKVLEFNVRFGDPETQPILFRLKSDLVPVLQCVAERNLKSAPALEWDPQPAVCVVIASGGYPGPYEKGKVIAGLGEAATLPDTMVFHAGTALKDGEVVTAGGRVLGVTARGATIQDAKARAYAACERIRFDGAHYRTDIADRAMSHLA